MSRAYLRRSEAARYLQDRYGAFTIGTLAKLAVIGGGPPFRKSGKFPLYLASELDAWAEARMSKLVHSTAELADQKAA